MDEFGSLQEISELTLLPLCPFLFEDGGDEIQL